MRSRVFITLLLCIMMLWNVMETRPVWATPVLEDWAFNVNGDFYSYKEDGKSLSDISDLNTSDFDSLTGLGTLTWTYQNTSTASQDFYFIAFFDHEIDQNANTYYNEYGVAIGDPADGQSWEIDEPGYIFGDIYNHVKNHDLDNDNAIPEGSDPTNDNILGDDVSMALGWDFSLDAGDTATITLTLMIIEDLTGYSHPSFYLSHTDPDSDETIYFWSTLDITPQGGGGGGQEPIPEPATLFLFGTGIIGLAGFRWHYKK